MAILKMQGNNEFLYRLRVGNYRIIFNKQGQVCYIEKLIIVVKYIKIGGKYMDAIKERIVGAVSIMDEDAAKKCGIL